jgi:hypothetical protein
LASDEAAAFAWYLGGRRRRQLRLSRAAYRNADAVLAEK